MFTVLRIGFQQEKDHKWLTVSCNRSAQPISFRRGILHVGVVSLLISITFRWRNVVELDPYKQEFVCIWNSIEEISLHVRKLVNNANENLLSFLSFNSFDRLSEAVLGDVQVNDSTPLLYVTHNNFQKSLSSTAIEKDNRLGFNTFIPFLYKFTEEIWISTIEF